MIVKLLMPTCVFFWICFQKEASSASSVRCHYHQRRILSSMQERAFDGLDIVDVMVDIGELSTGLPIGTVAGIVEKIVAFSKGGEPSLWDLLQAKVNKEIRTEFSKVFAIERNAVLCTFRYKLSEFAARGTAIANSSNSDVEDKKHYISTIKAHLDDTLANIHKFDFKLNRGSLVFDWSLPDMYIAAITHQRLVLFLLIAACSELPPGEPDPDHHAATYIAHLNKYAADWERYAKFDGIQAVKELYWRDTSCEETGGLDWDTTGDTLTCTNFERVYKVKFSYGLLGPPQSAKFKENDLQDGYPMGCQHEGGCWLEWNQGYQCVKHNSGSKKTCGSSPRRFYLPVAERMWNQFTVPVLKLLNVEPVKGLKKREKATTATEKLCSSGTTCKNPDNHVLGPWCKTSKGEREECFNTKLPKKIFPGDCVSPCGKWGTAYKWCAKRYSKYHPFAGGKWVKC